MESKELRDKAIAIVLKNFNLNGLIVDVIDELLEEALKKVVADSSNKFDDALMELVYPILERELKALVAKYVASIGN